VGGVRPRGLGGPVFSSAEEVTIPGAAIFLTVLPINYIGDGLRDALDPRKVLGKPFLRPLRATGYSGTIRKLFRPLIR